MRTMHLYRLTAHGFGGGVTAITRYFYVSVVEFPELFVTYSCYLDTGICYKQQGFGMGCDGHVSTDSPQGSKI